MRKLCKRLIKIARRLADYGLNQGTAGNLSARAEKNGGAGYLITPTGMRYGDLDPDDLVFMPLDGRHAVSKRRPSSEWRLHHAIYARYPEAGAVLHAHSPFAVSLSCLRQDIPPFHYMIARFGGDSVRCADYATFGTQALSDAALLALEGRTACLLSNHGQLVFGGDLDRALDLGVELETLCEQYWRARQLGAPVLLTPEEMRVVIEKFRHYGQQTPGVGR